ncbi:MAG: endolytic transglycosylase MltG, partial [Oscillospiraceae bacterium]|nr:endolytic transglycosylase MltG [Oscillospiraceae bacterium]
SGLPVAPVGNPGMDAIMAAAHPEDTPYFFFVSDAEGEFYYAVTFDEHIYNVRRAGLLGEITGIATEE